VILVGTGSFSTQSNIFAYQGVYTKEMLLAMSTEDKDLYGEYFERYNNYLKALFVDRGPVVLSDKKLYRKFNHALLSTCPKVNYIVSPWRYTVYHTLFKFTPVKVRDWLVQRFVQMPAWNQAPVVESKPEIVYADPKPIEDHLQD
jgi:hypothetical protein